VGKEKGMVINVECQRQALRAERSREEIEVSQEIFGGIKVGAGVVAGGIIEDIEEHLFIGLAGQPTMRRGIVLPECPQVASLPALDWFGLGFETSIGASWLWMAQRRTLARSVLNLRRRSNSLVAAL